MTSTVGLPLVCLPIGIPRPLSVTIAEPSLARVTVIWSAYPLKASSIELSTISYTKWCKPRASVDPIYIPGRFLTASSPSNTWIELSS